MTIMGVQWDQLPKLQVRWLDERETCNLVNRVAHDGAWAEDAEMTSCDSFSAGICWKAGGRNRVDCAFLDRGFDWLRAADWQPVEGGGVMYAPELNEHRVKGRRNGRK